jgi:hypothetical protein
MTVQRIMVLVGHILAEPAGSGHTWIYAQGIKPLRPRPDMRGFAISRPGGSAAAMRDAPPKPAEPRPGLYRHYKDNPYRVIGLALHSETREWLVVYEALYGDGGLFVRPAAMFVETVEVAGKRVPRFARVGE